MIQNFSPYVRRAWYSRLKPFAKIGEREIFDYELLYIKEGEAIVTIEGQDYSAVPGDVFLLRPKKRHTIRSLYEKSLIQPHIHFDLQYRDDYQEVYIPYITSDQMPPENMRLFREDILNQLLENIPVQIHLKNAGIFEQFIFELIDELEKPSPITQVRQQWLFLRLFDLFLSESMYALEHKMQTHSQSVANKIKLYLDNNQSRHITLDELSRVMFLEKSYIGRVFKRYYQDTPIGYHQKLRIQKAKNLLIYTNLTITQIASLTGFASIHDFDRVFKKLEGKKPSSYR